MTAGDFGARLAAVVPPDRIQRDAPLAPFTTFKVGGPADWLVLAQRASEVKAALGAARDAGLPVTVLGGGSNVLVSDAGVRGVVIRVHSGDVRSCGENTVRADGGLTINGLVRWTADMEFGYDRSRLQRTREVVLSADFLVGRGEPAALRAVARESLAYRKRTQPLESSSAGCIFQNPDPAVDRVPDGIPPSAGALVDRAGLKGARAGAARVSPTHGNFIVNEGGASADDIRRLIERCRDQVRAQFEVELRDEIVYVGF